MWLQENIIFISAFVSIFFVLMLLGFHSANSPIARESEHPYWDDEEYWDDDIG